MRLWTLHPQYLDPQGLVAAWREGLLAQKVLMGGTKGYRNHPQLIRFRRESNSLGAMAVFLSGIAEEATRRGYHFDATKIARHRFHRKIVETDGQLLYEWRHLREKLKRRSPQMFLEIQDIEIPEPHPVFQIVAGEIREWEKSFKKIPRERDLTNL